MSTKSKDWANQVDQYLHHKKGAGLVNEPIAVSSLQSFIDNSEFPNVPEFVDFYRCVNGFGVKLDDKISWQVSPIEHIPQVIQDGRSIFSDTHPDIAARFYPFIDTGWRAYIGYLFSESGELLKGLYYFDPDNYYYDEDQEWEDFIDMKHPDLYDYIRNCVIFS